MNTRTVLRGADLAIPTATLRRVVDEIVAHGGVRRGYLGVGAYPVGVAAAQAAGQASGALIASLEDGGPAATRRPARRRHPGHARRGSRSPAPTSCARRCGDRGGQSVDVVLIRAGATQTIKVAIGTKP